MYYNSDFVSRAMKELNRSRGGLSKCKTATTSAVIGISTPSFCANSKIGWQLLNASQVWLVTAIVSSTERPLPRFSPNVRFRESGDWHVATKSPTPASPRNVPKTPKPRSKDI